MRHLLVFIFLIVVTGTTFSQNSNIESVKVTKIRVTDKILNFKDEVRQTRTYSLIKKEYGDSLLTFTYMRSTYPNGDYSFNIKNGTFTLLKAPSEDSTLSCVDTIEIKINGIKDKIYKYEPTNLMDDGEGCVIFSKKFGIIASSDYSHRAKRLITKWKGTRLKLDTLLNYNSVNLLKNNNFVGQQPEIENKK